METFSITELRRNCSAVVERVRETGRPVTITRRGQPLGQIAPAPPEKPRTSTFGCMAGTAEILGDIVAPPGDAG